LNAALAVATMRAVEADLPITDEQIAAGLTQVDWPGRLQILQRPSGKKILLDGAHNLAGAEALKAALEDQFPAAKWTLVIGILRDKDWRGICHTLAPLASRIMAVPVNSERATAPAELAEGCRKTNPGAKTVGCSSLAAALDQVGYEPFLLITGSLYLVGEALERLESATAHTRNERGLNEWGSIQNQPQPVHGAGFSGVQ